MPALNQNNGGITTPPTKPNTKNAATIMSSQQIGRVDRQRVSITATKPVGKMPAKIKPGQPMCVVTWQEEEQEIPELDQSTVQRDMSNGTLILESSKQEKIPTSRIKKAPAMDQPKPPATEQSSERKPNRRAKYGSAEAIQTTPSNASAAGPALQ